MNLPLSLYFHWPYCASKCTYCAFNKYNIPKGGQDYPRLENALITDLKYQLSLAASNRIHSVYFGGGTPSLARPELIERILNLLQIRKGVEVTLEVNPSSSGLVKLRDFQLAGINRVSIGVQSLHSQVLMEMGRDHSVKDAFETIRAAKRFFDNISLDFIYARPNQSLSSWEKELHAIIRLEANHLSLYQLMFERGTPLFKKMAANQIQPLNDEACADIYEKTVELTQAHGYYQYEVSSFAKASCFQSNHNKAYWQGVDYLGIGPGAHGRFRINNKRNRTFAVLEPNAYMSQCESLGHGIKKQMEISDTESLKELVVFGLRMMEGVELTKELIGGILDMSQVQACVDHDLLVMNESHLKPTTKGLQVMDAILSRIFKIN